MRAKGNLNRSNWILMGIAAFSALLLLCVLVAHFLRWHTQMPLDAEVENFHTYCEDEYISLRWKNPSTKDFLGTQLTISCESTGYRQTVSLEKWEESYTFAAGEHGKLYTFQLCIKRKNDSISKGTTDSALFLDMEQLPDLPVLNIETHSGKDPSCEQAINSAGGWGSSVTNNEYEPSRLMLREGEITTYNGVCSVKVWGNTSALLEKKPYRLELQTATNLIDITDTNGAHTQWNLLPKGTNLTEMVGHLVAELCGSQWQPKCRYVNLILNGDWKGMYMLFEAVSVSDNRCNLSESGFLIENDAYWWNEEKPSFALSTQEQHPLKFTFQYPQDKALTEEVVLRVQKYMSAFTEALCNDNPDYQYYIDLEACAGWLLTHTIMGTYDGGGSNMFWYKPDYIPTDPLSTKLVMGPAWDFDSSFICKEEPRVVQSNINYCAELLQQESFRKTYARQWREIGPVLKESVAAKIEEIKNQQGLAIEQSRQLDAARWGTDAVSIEAEMTSILDWFSMKTQWLNEKISEW